MVGLVERFRRPKPPVILGSPRRDRAGNQRLASRAQNVPPPVLRNFSYPTNVTNNNLLVPKPTAREERPSTWDQLGEICNFSSNTRPCTRRDRTAGLEDPFFYTTDRTPYRRLVDIDENHNINLTTNESTILGRQALPQKCSLTAKLKRSSLGHHKTSSAFDTPRLLTRSNSLERPMSSSGVPLIDTRLSHLTNDAIKLSVDRRSFARSPIEEFLLDSDKANHLSYNLSDRYIITMDPPSSRSGPNRLSDGSKVPSEGRQCETRASETNRGKGKEGKNKWFSQLKEWISVSEPSTQALKNYKKDTYNKAGIALDDPLAKAKLHLPVTSLPPDAIKPGGRGLEPEEVVIKKAIQRKKAQAGLISQGSQSSTSHYSSTSTVTANTSKVGD
ncbi:hypothetical protein NPX13_g1326 [Xylaria arbuscula]|uniref:Uncharacterized protein n=1 Tax=Xylaria arbuscula TaxID=114810 RepID=A0A9W8NMX8_9PEZI|nr:hypothetical protein NPX13_g1326 [Xylaria arbuscula]